MKKAFLFLGIFALLSGCNEKASEDAVEEVPVVEEVPDGIEAEIVSFEFEDAIERADLVAEVIIGEKLEEVKEQPVPYTLFEAEIKEVISGTPVSNNIVIKQQGDSEWTVNDTELFEIGEEYIFFLKENTISKGDYWIIGEDTGMFQSLENDVTVKLNAPVEELEEIELEAEELEEENTLFESEEDYQIVNKEEFIDKIQTQEGEE